MNDEIDFADRSEDWENDDNQGMEPETSEVERLQIELDQAKDRALRALADLENYRNRAHRQMADERKYANIDIMREMLPVWDNIGRALEAAEKTHNLESLVEGVKLVHQQFIDVLKKFHCEEIVALHEPFNPHFHASIAQTPNVEYPVNTVVYVSQPGFILHDRVVRPSQVVLSSGKPAE